MLTTARRMRTLRGFAVRNALRPGELAEPRSGSPSFSRLVACRSPIEAGHWLDGFLGEGGQILLYDTVLVGLIDAWLCALGEEDFITLLPMLRRAFSGFDRSERRRLLDGLRQPMRDRYSERRCSARRCGSSRSAAPGFAAALPLLLTILGVDARNNHRERHGDHSRGKAASLAARARRRRRRRPGDRDRRLDRALAGLYDATGAARVSAGRGRVGAAASAPRAEVARWLGDIREFFPSPVVQVIQKDAFERLGLKQMLLEPEFLAALEADVHLIADLIALARRCRTRPRTRRARWWPRSSRR